MAAFVIERQAVLTDLAVEMFDKLVGSARRTAERRHEENLLAQAKVLAAMAHDHAALGRALLEARKAGNLADAVERALGWERLAASVKVAEDAAGGRAEGDGIEEMIGRRTTLRRAAAIDFGAQTRRLMRAGSWGCSQATRCDTGMPRRVIRFSTAQAARASVF